MQKKDKTGEGNVPRVPESDLPGYRAISSSTSNKNAGLAEEPGSLTSRVTIGLHSLPMARCSFDEGVITNPHRGRGFSSRPSPSERSNPQLLGSRAAAFGEERPSLNSRPWPLVQPTSPAFACGDVDDAVLADAHSDSRKSLPHSLGFKAR